VGRHVAYMGKVGDLDVHELYKVIGLDSTDSG